jgi:hypothetical protein
MTSDSEVQEEGVRFFKKLEEHIDRQNTAFLIFTVISSLVKKVHEAEPAKTAALRIMEAFTAIPEEE